MPPTSPTHTLLLSLGNSDAPRLHAALTGIDTPEWKEVFQLSMAHGVAALLYKRLNDASANVPVEIIQKLRTAYLRCAAFNARLYAELSSVLLSLNRANVQVIVLKGAFLAEAVYQNIALRPMADIDLLVRKESLGTLTDALCRQGYARQDFPTTNAQDGDLVIFNKPGCPPIDVHLSIAFKNIVLAADDLWKRSRPITLAGAEALSLSPEDLLCHLSFHAFYQHGFTIAGLRALCDVAETLRRYGNEIDAERLWSHASSLSMTNALGCMLALVKNCLGVTHACHTGAGFVSFAADERNQQMVAIAENLILRDQAVMIAQSEDFSAFFGAKTLAEKFCLVLNSVFPPRRVMASLYNLPQKSWRFVIYYPVRIFGLCRQYGAAIVKKIFGDKHVSAWAETQRKRTALREWMEQR